jgi:hypothetical protein
LPSIPIPAFDIRSAVPGQIPEQRALSTRLTRLFHSRGWQKARYWLVLDRIPLDLMLRMSRFARQIFLRKFDVQPCHAYQILFTGFRGPAAKKVRSRRSPVDICSGAGVT